MRKHKTHEEKVAVKMSELVNDYNLDLHEVGKYFARVSSLVSFTRVKEILEVAELEKDNQYVREHHYPLF